ncbi:hypothetical protein BJ508DRAFT_215038 [Ascobolus immersus RN42]|uniref:Cupredoxin n=1 Tax=Ascobolus immersus RN42 TaxID=1160509 RepID=A0A3N4HM03_ASCIM|nr:hypothetical protein BJ508DRAFT_215038 [Ascobolus immersus RN42]
MPAIIDESKPLHKRGDDDRWQSPQYKWSFSKPLAIPPIKGPSGSFVDPVTGEKFSYYEVHIKEFKQEIYPGKLTTFVGYDGISPGPTFKMNVGERSVVRFVNEANTPSSIHLHGSPSRPPFDGWAEDTIAKGNYKDYVWPNVGARTLWYHDHAMHVTAVNAFYGQAGFYILQDPVKEAALNLPNGKYDVPLSIVDRIYRTNGELVSPAGEDDSYWGDVIHVNGVPWPYLEVEPRKYRFRICDMSLSRSYKMSIQTKSNVKVPYHVIATDAGYVQTPIPTSEMVLGIGERYEIVVDFASYAGQNLTMRNPRDFSKNEDFALTNQIMQFRVAKSLSSTGGNGNLPSQLTTLEYPPNPNRVDRTFKFERTNGQWKINGVGFAEASKRVLAKPAYGNVEVWRLENSSGGWAHPIHIHLIDFKVLSRSSSRGVQAYENGYKDVVQLLENESVTVLARFQPWKGEYMFHCHNLIHEDDDMMASFDVANTKANAANGDIFSNPMNPQFRDKPFTGSPSLSEIEGEILPYWAGLKVYEGFN